MKAAAKLIAFVAAYTAVAYLVLILLGVMTSSDVESGPTLLAALMVAMVTVLFDEKGTVPKGARVAVMALLVPVTLAWAYHGYQMATATFPERGYLLRAVVCLALFLAPTVIGRRLRKARRARKG